MDYEIAQLQGRRATRSKIQADLAIIDNDKEALRLMDTDSPALEPHQAEIRIQEHNRKYPKDQIASIADFNGEMDKFQEQIDRVLEDTNRKLREVK